MSRYGSDVVVELLMAAGIEHVALNPGASFRGIHDSIVHTDGAPELVLCLHEAVAVAAAQGYAKACGRPMGVLLHDVVGLQNASMAIYNAWCDRAPMLLVGGTGPKSKVSRRPWIDWIHTASVQANIVRDYVKWDDEPHDVRSIPESFARGMVTARSAPSGPVYLCYDVGLQEDPWTEDVDIAAPGAFAVPTQPAPSAPDVAWLAETLREASRPVILAGHAGDNSTAFAELVELAEILGAPVVDTGLRHAFPTSHPLSAQRMDGVLEEADVVLALDVEDLQGWLPDSARVLNVTVSHLRLRAWAHDYQSLLPAERHITATSEEAVRAVLALLRAHPPATEVVRARMAKLSGRIHEGRRKRRADAAHAEGDGVIPVERVVWEVGQALTGQRFVLANRTNAAWESRLWDLDRPRQALGWHGGGGLGYGVAAAVGASVALGPDSIVVDVQADGDLLYLPNALWTAARQRLPILVVVHNNRQYGNTVEHAATIAADRGRSTERRHVGAGLTEPAVDLAALAASFGVWSAGPIADADTLTERLAEAVAVVRSGRPALLDVLTPGF